MRPVDQLTPPAPLAATDAWIEANALIWFPLLDEASDCFIQSQPFDFVNNRYVKQIPANHRETAKRILQESVESYACTPVIDVWKSDNQALWDAAFARFLTAGRALDQAEQNKIVQELQAVFPHDFAKEFLGKHLFLCKDQILIYEKIAEHLEMIERNGGPHWDRHLGAISRSMPIYAPTRRTVWDNQPLEPNKETQALLTECLQHRIDAQINMNSTNLNPHTQAPFIICSKDYAALLTQTMKERKHLALIQKRFDEMFKDPSSGPWGIQILPVDLFKYKIVAPPGSGPQHLKKLYSIFLLLKNLNINTVLFENQLPVFNESVAQNPDRYFTITQSEDLAAIAELFQKGHDFEDRLEAIFKFFPQGNHAILQGNKPLVDLYQRSPVAKENYEKDLGIDYYLAVSIEMDRAGTLIFSDSIMITTTSDHLMLFLEKAYQLLNLKPKNKSGLKMFIAGTREAGKIHQSNINMDQMREIQGLLTKIHYATEAMNEADLQTLFYGLGAQPPQQIEAGFARVIRLYATRLKQEIEQSALIHRDNRVVQMLDMLLNAKSFEMADSIKCDIYRYSINQSLQPASDVWTDRNSIDLAVVRQKLGTTALADQERGSLDAKKGALETRTRAILDQFESLDFFVQNARGDEVNSHFSTSYQKLVSTLLNGIRTAQAEDQHYGIIRVIQAVDFLERFVYSMKFTPITDPMKNAILAFFTAQSIDEHGADTNEWNGCQNGLRAKTQELLCLSIPELGLNGAIQKTKMDLFARYFSLRNDSSMLNQIEQDHARRESGPFRNGIRAQVSRRVGLGVDGNDQDAEMHNDWIRYALFFDEGEAFIRCNLRPYEHIYLPALDTALTQLSVLERNAGDLTPLMQSLGLTQQQTWAYADAMTGSWLFENIRHDLPALVLKQMHDQGYLAPKQREASAGVYASFIATLRQNNPAAYQREITPDTFGGAKSAYFSHDTRRTTPIIIPGQENFAMQPASTTVPLNAVESSSSSAPARTLTMIYSRDIRPLGAPSWGEFARLGFQIPGFTAYESILIGDHLMPLILNYDASRPHDLLVECNTTQIDLGKMAEYLKNHSLYTINLQKNAIAGNSAKELITAICIPKPAPKFFN